MSGKPKKVQNLMRGCSLPVRLSLIFQNAHRIHPRYYKRILGLLAVSLLRYPVMKYEERRYRGRIQQTEIAPDPIFVIGHWRSGTTHLHNILVQDDRYGFPSLYHTAFPQCFFTYEKLKPEFEKRLPSSRPMDNMKVSLDLPQEEEFGLANLSRYSFYHSLSFPRSARWYFERYGTFETATAREIALWKCEYIHFLKKVTLACEGKPLVLKNPINTGRVRFLLEMFPHAKFIHIYRNPYEVFCSTFKMIRSMTETMQLQEIDTQQMEETILQNYEDLMQRYLQDRKIIPQSQLAEIAYEDLIHSPLDELQSIYTKLSLPDYAYAQPRFAQYLKQEKEYRRNVFQCKPEWLEQINRRWAFTLQEWNYTAPVMDTSSQRLDNG